MVESISMDELDGLAVHGETTVGWDENTPPNETVDEDGQPFPIDSGFGQPDPRSPTRRVYDDPDVDKLRAYLRQHNEHAQHICRFIKTKPGEWPAGAGVMHPLASQRKQAVERGRD